MMNAVASAIFAAPITPSHGALEAAGGDPYRFKQKTACEQRRLPSRIVVNVFLFAFDEDAHDEFVISADLEAPRLRVVVTWRPPREITVLFNLRIRGGRVDRPCVPLQTRRQSIRQIKLQSLQ